MSHFGWNEFNALKTSFAGIELNHTKYMLICSWCDLKDPGAASSVQLTSLVDLYKEWILL